MKQRRTKRANSAQIFAFPSSRHCRIVAFIAAEMRKKTSLDEAEGYLIGHLDMEWSRLAHLGIADTEIELHCRAFAKAAWQIVFKDHPTWGAA